MKRNSEIVIKIIGIILISLLLLLVFTNPVLSVDDNSPIKNQDFYKPNTKEAENATKLAEMGNDIVGVVQVIGTVLSVAILAVIGIKYMIGSVEERAEYKNSMKPYIIGAALVFGITNILNIIVNVVDVVF